MTAMQPPYQRYQCISGSILEVCLFETGPLPVSPSLQ